MSDEAFRQKLQHLINCESMENGSDTPDFMLAEYLMACLNNWNDFVKRREKWYGRESTSVKHSEPCSAPPL